MLHASDSRPERIDVMDCRFFVQCAASALIKCTGNPKTAVPNSNNFHSLRNFRNGNGRTATEGWKPGIITLMTT